MRELWVKHHFFAPDFKTRRTALILLLFCGCVSLCWSVIIATSDAGLSDLKAYYYASRCLLEHRDPYREAAFLQTYRQDGGRFSSDTIIAAAQHRGIPICVNVPSTLFLLTPLAVLPWRTATVLWMMFQFLFLIFAAYLSWDITCFVTGVDTLGFPLALLCILVADCEILLSLGNLAGPVICLIVFTVWCLLRNRFILAGVFCMAVSLALKPHDAGFIWLYLLFATVRFRKRALQSLWMTCLLCLPALLWVSHAAPHWPTELHSNLVITSQHGDINDPGPASLGGHTPNSIIDLQSIFSLFSDNPHIYNPLTYLICAPLILTVLVTEVRSKFSCQRAVLAIAAIVPLTMLVTYHRPYDAKLLMLDVPAYMLLWKRRGAVGWIALVLTTAGIVFTSDLPLALITVFTSNLPRTSHGISRVLLSVLLLHPGTLVLLSLSVFYLWMHIRWTDQLHTEDALQLEPYATEFREHMGNCS